MAKNRGSANRDAKVAKAGKRSGNTVYPAPLSSERRAAREQGEQQFISPNPLSVEREATIIVFDSKIGQFVYKTKKISLPAPYIFDAARGRVVYDPTYKEKDVK